MAFRDPFNWKDEEQLLLVSRYLIESNEEDYVYIDTTRISEINIVKSVFRKLVGAYVIDEELDAKTMEEVGSVRILLCHILCNVKLLDNT